jgi:hypothetical protein
MLSRYHLAGLLVALGCVACKDSTPPPKPARISVNTAVISGVVNGAVVPSPTFTVVDDKGDAIGDVAVSLSVTSGGGTLNSAPTKSSGGPTPIGQWILGPNAGLNTVSIVVSGLAPVSISADGRTPYLIDLRYFGTTVPAAIQAVFAAAKSRIEGMITGDVPDITGSGGPLEVATCGVTGVAPVADAIDDIVIFAAIDSIDGPGKILGSSGPCYVRPGTQLPLIGVMHFDVADMQGYVNDGRANDLILHEMLHALGFGTIWSGKALISGAATASSAYTGPGAVAGCLFHGGTAPNQCGNSTVPLETTGGGGTRDSHWRKNTSSTGIGFRTELMTGFISPAGVIAPLSRISVGSLSDIGYTVNLSLADSYTVPSTAAQSYAIIAEATGAGAALRLNEVLLYPQATVSTSRVVTRIPR